MQQYLSAIDNSLSCLVVSARITRIISAITIMSQPEVMVIRVVLLIKINTNPIFFLFNSHLNTQVCQDES
jgi:hypothetical protein